MLRDNIFSKNWNNKSPDRYYKSADIELNNNNNNNEDEDEWWLCVVESAQVTGPAACLSVDVIRQMIASHAGLINSREEGVVSLLRTPETAEFYCFRNLGVFLICRVFIFKRLLRSADQCARWPWQGHPTLCHKSRKIYNFARRTSGFMFQNDLPSRAEGRANKQTPWYKYTDTLRSKHFKPNLNISSRPLLNIQLTSWS